MNRVSETCDGRWLLSFVVEVRNEMRPALVFGADTIALLASINASVDIDYYDYRN